MSASPRPIGKAALSTTSSKPVAASCGAASVPATRRTSRSFARWRRRGKPTTSRSFIASGRPASSARWIASTRPGSRPGATAFAESDLASLRRLVPLLALGDQMRVADAHRPDDRRGISRTRCGGPGFERPHCARCRRPDQGRHLVLGLARLHEDHRHGAARRDHSAAQRLRGGRDRRRSQRGWRSAQAHRRRRAGDLSRRRCAAGVPQRAARRSGDRDRASKR